MTPPAILYFWPPTGTALSGDSVTVRGAVSEPGSTVTLLAIAEDGTTTTYTAVMERDGAFWVDDVTVKPGTTTLVTTVTDPAGNTTTTTNTVTQSGVQITLDPSLTSNADLNQDLAGTVSGTISSTNYAVWVNGVMATLTSTNGSTVTWTAAGVAAGTAGVGLIQVVAIPWSSNGGYGITNTSGRMARRGVSPPGAGGGSGGSGSGGSGGAASASGSAANFSSTGNPTDPDAITVELDWEKPTILYIADAHVDYTNTLATLDTNEPPIEVKTVNWTDAVGGTGSVSRACTYTWTLDGRGYNESGAWSTPECQTNLFGSVDTFAYTFAGREATIRYANVSGSTDDLQPADSSFTGHQQMHVTLRVGGRAGNGESKLVRFNGYGHEYEARYMHEPFVTHIVVSAGPLPASLDFVTYDLGIIPPTNILVAGQALGVDGQLFIALEAGSTQDITPSTGLNFYEVNFGVADATPDLDVDSLNGGLNGNPANTWAEEQAEDVSGNPAKPGKILFVNNGDADSDGIPNFADGYGLFGDATTNAAAGGQFAPLLLKLPPSVDLSRAVVRFAYSASNPTNVTAQTNSDGQVTYTPAGGLRLWMKPGSAVRNPAAVTNDGDFMEGSAEMAAASLPFWLDDDGRYRLTLFVEALSQSTAAGDQTVQVQVDPDGTNGPAGFDGEDQVRFTVLEAKLAEATNETVTTITDEIKDSHSSPMFTNVVASLTDVRSSADGTRLIGRLTVSGDLNCAMCDLVPGDEGVIPFVRVILNGDSPHSDAAAVPTTVSKSTNVLSFTRPYSFSASFALDVDEVEISTGLNWIRVEASDQVPGVGLTGFAEFTTVVTATPVTVTVASPPEGTASSPGGPYFGWDYTVSPTTPTTQSSGGELHPYYVQIEGPSAVLENLAQRASTRIIEGDDSRYYVGDTNGRPVVNVALIASFARSAYISPNTLSFKAGFTAGFAQQGVKAVIGTARFFWTGVGVLGAAVMVDVGINSADAHDRLCKFNTDVEQLSQAANALYQFTLKVGQSEWAALEAMARGEWAQADAQSEPIRLLCQFGLELVWSVGTNYAGASDFERGKIQGEVCLEILSAVVPAAKLGQVSKLGLLSSLRTRPFFAGNPRLLALLDQAIALVSAPPALGGTGTAGDKVADLARVLMRQGLNRRQAFKRALVEVVENAGERKIAERLRIVSDSILDELPDIPTTQQMDDVFTVADWKAFIQAKSVKLAKDGPSDIVVPGAGDLRGHHIVTEDIQERLIELGVNISDVNKSPVKIFTHTEHFGQGQNSLHYKMYYGGDVNASGKGRLHPDRLQEFVDQSEMMDELIRFYVNNGYSDQAKAVRGWCGKNGIPFTQ